MIAFFKRFIQWIKAFFFAPIAPKVKVEPKAKAPTVTLYFDTYITFKNQPLIGKLYQNGKKIWRVVDYDIKNRRFHCKLEEI